MSDKEEIEALKAEIASMRKTIDEMRSTYYIFKNMIELHEKTYGELKGIGIE